MGNQKKIIYVIITFVILGLISLTLSSEIRSKFLFYLFVGLVYFIISTWINSIKK